MLDNISEIHQLAKNVIGSIDDLSVINLQVEVISAKEYKSMIFLTIADKTDKIDAVVYEKFYDKKIRTDDRLQIFGSANFYRGKLQISIVSYSIKAADGQSDMKLLCDKLSNMGLFENKPEINHAASAIGLITSISAAGLKDFIHTFNEKNHGKKIYIYPSSMQGNSAPDELRSAILLANAHNCVDIIAIIRGGGAREDLSCFDNESVAKSIYSSSIPIVTGIGHQMDVTVADMTSAKSYITPTAVANNLLETVEQENNAAKYGQIICSRMENIRNYLEKNNSKLNSLKESIVSNIECMNNKITFQQNYLNLTATHNLSNIHDYIGKSRGELDQYMSIHINTLRDRSSNLMLELKNYSNSLGNYISRSERILDKYGKPQLYEIKKNKKIKISLLENVKSSKKYILEFMDGDLEIEM